jgi:3-oxoacyl-[acyl-carrier protein] reductase
MPGNPLAGQVALITGAAKRIGRSIALRLAADGADIVVNYASSKPEADTLVAEIKSTGRRAIAA